MSTLEDLEHRVALLEAASIRHSAELAPLIIRQETLIASLATGQNMILVLLQADGRAIAGLAGQMADHTRTLAEHGELLREIVRLLRPGRRTGPPKANS